MKKTLLSIITLSIVNLVFAKDIHVSKSGNNTNAGTLASPYLTISKAAIEANPGDIVYIHEGTYEETLTPSTSGTAGNPIVFTSYQNESVIISAMQTVNGFTLDSGNIYKATLDWDLGHRMFVMNNNTPLDLARWPNNIDGDRFTINSRRSQGGSAHPDNSDRSKGHLLNNEIPNLPWQNGGTLWFYGDRPGSGWTSWKFPITASSAGRVDFSNAHDPNSYWVLGFHPPKDGGDFFLEGIKEALDYQNEWYFNSTTKELFLQLPSGSAPVDGTIQVSRRENTININKNHIEIRNLAVYGGSIKLNGDFNKLYQVSSFYGGMTRGNEAKGISTDIAAVKIDWSNPRHNGNTIEKCEIGFADAAGITERGTNTLIKNNYIHDIGYLGNYDNPIRSRDASNTKILNNTITRSGRDGMNLINNNSEVAWNDVSRSNKIADDCALFYYSGPSNAANAAAAPKNIEIHHNWFHDSEGRGKLRKAAGIYLDTNPNKFDVHHNVVWNVEWTAIQMNWNAIDINVYNNTFMKAQGGAMGAWHLAGTEFKRVNVWNNVADEGRIDDPSTQEDEGTFEEQSDKRNNTITKVGFVDYNGNDFSLTASNAKAVNKGIVIPGITDNAIGLPDIGAYELGVPAWKPGVDWILSNGPASICYNLPGETCSSPPPPPPPVSASVNFVAPLITQIESNVDSFTATVDYTTSTPGQAVFVEMRKIDGSTFLTNNFITPDQPEAKNNIPITITIPTNQKPLPIGTYPLLTFIRTPNPSSPGGFDYSSQETIQIEVVESSTLTVKDFNFKNATIYPNPATEQLNIQGINQTTDLIIFDLAGNKVVSKTITEENATVNVGSLAEGVYILTNTNRTAFFKFIKQN